MASLIRGKSKPVPTERTQTQKRKLTDSSKPHFEGKLHLISYELFTKPTPGVRAEWKHFSDKTFTDSILSPEARRGYTPSKYIIDVKQKTGTLTEKKSKWVCQDLGEKESHSRSMLEEKGRGHQEGCFQEKQKLVYYPNRFVLEKMILWDVSQCGQKAVEDARHRFKSWDMDFLN